jgi:hypothetical protein
MGVGGVSYELDIEIPSLPTMNASARSNRWVLIKEKKRWAQLVGLFTAGKRPKEPLQKALVTFTRCSSACPD